jgi:hypothetical protein
MDGRVGTFSAKVGDILRTADTSAAGVLVTVNRQAFDALVKPPPVARQLLDDAHHAW